MLQGNIIWSGSAAMVRRVCFEKSGVFDPDVRFVEDWEMWIRISKNYSFAVIKEPLVYYRFHPNNKSKNHTKIKNELRLIVEKSFQSVPFELLHLRNKAYSNINFIIAWKSIKYHEPDCNQAEYYRNLALKHNPRLLFSKQNFQLTRDIFLIRWLGAKGYTQVKTQVKGVRQLIGNFTT